jgi:pimeloyl-ACP methyl ester carboxylesterase
MDRILWPRGTLRVENGAILPAPGQLRSPDGFTRIYVLVHGFNNDRAKAEVSYRAFRERIADMIGLHMSQRIWEFYWPGYEELVSQSLRRYWATGLVNTAYTAASYYKQVPKAITFGSLLGKYLLQLRASSQATEVVLIGHSLGCRLILEALAEMMVPHTPNSKVPAVLLMAGAVPIQHLEPAGYLRAAAQFPQRRIVLYSARDTVLRWTFPAGQVLANDGGLRPEASGLHGHPRDCWTARDHTMLRHGDYWSHKNTTPNIVRLFGKSTPHALPYSEILPRTLPDPPPLPQWRSPERHLGT